MQSYKLDQVSSIPKTAKTGRQYISLGIKVGGEWYNGFGREGVTDQWQSGQSVTGIVLYEEEYNGKMYKKWKFVSNEERLDDLESRVKKLEDIQLGGMQDQSNQQDQTDSYPEEPPYDDSDFPF